LCSSLRSSGHLPAPTVNGGGDRVGKVQFSELQKPCDLDLKSGHTAYRCASVIFNFDGSLLLARPEKKVFFRFQ